MNIQFLKTEAEVALVDLRESLWPNAIFITVSPNPYALVKAIRRVGTKLKLVPIHYGSLRQFEQHAYCMRVVKSSLNFSKDSKLFGTWELNKTGNVHLHILFTDPNVKNITTLQILRRDVLNSELVQDNMIGRNIDFMNNIVFVNDSISDRFKYMTKDMNMNLIVMPYFMGLFVD